MTTSPEVLIETTDVRVRIMHLGPGEATAWHRHSAVTDQMLGLYGALQVELRQPQEAVMLGVGERCSVAVGRRHRVVNRSATTAARYLLVQGVGRYDFIRDE